MSTCVHLLAVMALVSLGWSTVLDLSRSTTVIETDRLPLLKDEKTVDSRRMASVGNGHLATVVYNDSVYLNGLYSGRMGASHRARIPAEINVRVNFPPRGGQPREVFRRYKLDMENGYWEENITVKEAIVTQRIYAHQLYSRLLVTEVLAQRQGGSTGNIVMHLNITKGLESDDIQFSQKQDYNGGNWVKRGETAVPETDDDKRTPVFVYWTEIPNTFYIQAQSTFVRQTFIMSLDTNDEIAKESYESGMRLSNINPELFFASHKQNWKDKWHRGNIEMVGDKGDNILEKLCYSSFYYILSSLPTLKSNREPAPFFGMSPGSLAYGGKYSNDQGHVLWDMETWMLPPVLIFHPELAKAMLSYRLLNSAAAYENAKMAGNQGLQYPWESARSGFDVTPDTCPECRRSQIHITGAIAYAARLYVSATKDKLWLEQDGGCDFIRDMAAFWSGRATPTDRSSAYDINGVMPPDENHKIVDNSAYTNAVANLAINFAKYAACICGRDVTQEVPEQWMTIADNLKMEYNTTAKYHPAFQNYDRLSGQHRVVKQADAVFLGYPLMWNMSKVVRRNDLLIYSKEISPDAPATSLSMLTIGWLEIDDRQRASEVFDRSYKPYVLEPFKVWSDSSEGDGAANYLSGMSTFLQALIFGYGGARIRVEYLEMNPQLPQGITSMKFVDIDYVGATFNVRITEERVDVELITMGLYPLSLKVIATQQTFQLLAGNSNKASFKRGRFVVYLSTKSDCPIPADRIKNQYHTAQLSSGSGCSIQRLLPWTCVFFAAGRWLPV